MARSRFVLSGTPRDVLGIQVDTPFLIDPIIPQGGIAIIYGREGHFKSFLALAIARALALKEPLLSSFPPASGRTAYVSFDMPPGQVQERLRPIADDLGDSVWVEADNSPINIGEAKLTHAWVKNVRAFEPDLIIFDTLHKISPLPENESSTVAAVFHSLRYLFGPHPTLMPLHHEKKESANPEWRASPGQAYRGSGAWLADADSGIRVVKVKGRRGIVSFPRWRFSDEPPPIPIELDVERMIVVPSEAKGQVLARKILWERRPETRTELVKLLTEVGKMSPQRARRLALEVWPEEEGEDE